MGAEARREYEVKYTADENYRVLMEAYAAALRGANQGEGRRLGSSVDSGASAESAASVGSGTDVR